MTEKTWCAICGKEITGKKTHPCLPRKYREKHKRHRIELPLTGEEIRKVRELLKAHS